MLSFDDFLSFRERLARVSRAMAQLGHPRWSLCLGVWHVRAVFLCVSSLLMYHSSGKDTPTLELWTTGSARIWLTVFLNQGEITKRRISEF